MKLLHSDTLVITRMITNYEIHRILLDNRNFADILYMESFRKMNIGKDKLKLIKIPLMGFEGESVIVEGAIQLPVTIGQALDQVTSMVDFLVVDCPSVYNMIVRRTF